MNRTVGRVGGLAVSVVAAAPFVYLWVVSMRGADDPLTFRARLDMAIWTAVFGTPWMVAARLLWRAWWREAGARLSTLDGPALLLAAAAATLPADRHDWGAAMTAELAQVQGPASRWRFAAGCARAAVLPPRDHRAAAGVAGALATAATAAAALATGAALPAGRVFALTFVGLLGGLATLTLARSHRPRRPRPGPVVTGLALAGIAGCLGFTTWYLAGVDLADAGMISYLLFATPSVVLAGSVAAAVTGRSFRAGLWACAWATLLGVPLIIAAWLAEAPHWYRRLGGLLLDADSGVGMGANLGDATWWTLIVLVLWALPLGVLGAAAGSAPGRRRRTGEHAELAPPA
jgi:hypothetical protein